MTILENLYNGNINVVERSIKKGSEYDRLDKLSLELENKFIKGKSKQEKELFEQILELIYGQEEILLTETFVEGFRLGAQIMLEVFSEPKRQFTPIYENE
ncbi:MAG: hypothetical protein IJ027_07085 [Oscillospiraceae bacterium]|nr:hypothetical protein [Oscillospiraceae bacterium]